MALRNCRFFARLEPGQPSICIVMRDVQTRKLILMPCLQRRGTKHLAGLFAFDKLRNGLAEHPLH